MSSGTSPLKRVGPTNDTLFFEHGIGQQPVAVDIDHERGMPQPGHAQLVIMGAVEGRQVHLRLRQGPCRRAVVGGEQKITGRREKIGD